MKNIILLAFLSMPVAAMPIPASLISMASNACAHCIPVYEDTGDPCSIAGWCGNGNVRAWQYIQVPGGAVPSQCVMYTGQVCGVY